MADNAARFQDDSSGTGTTGSSHQPGESPSVVRPESTGYKAALGPRAATAALTDEQRRYDGYLATFNARREQHPEWREGQTHFNVLFFDGFDPEFANSIRGGPLDPFYVDERLPAYFDALRSHWNV